MANPQVDFYILQSTDARKRQVFACKLTEKAYRLGRKVFINTGSDAETRQLDGLLWTFRAGSFVPHSTGLQGKDDDPQAPVFLGTHSEATDHLDLLINLSPEMPIQILRFKRIAELIDQNETVRQTGRQHYREYQNQGCEVITHRL